MAKINNIFYINKFFILLFSWILFGWYVVASAQENNREVKLTVRGVVYDKITGETLADAGIFVNGRRAGESNREGRFTQDVSFTQEEDLYIDLKIVKQGYRTQTLPVDDPFRLQVVELLREGAVDPDVAARAQVGTRSRVGADVIEQEQTANTLNAIKGRATSVRTEDGILTVRGQNSLSRELSQPLYIIDGVPFPAQVFSSGSLPSSPLNVLNTTNVEKIEILKDADATAIYGGKGANGVVLITTKKQKETKLRIDASASAGITSVNSWYDFLSTEEYIDLRQKAFAADGITPDMSNAYDLLEFGDKYHTDWQKELIGKGGKVYTGALSVSGGNDRTYYYVNGDYFEADNIYLMEKGDKERRINTRILVNHIAYGGKLQFNASLAFNTFNSKSRGLDADAYVVYAPNQPVRNADGTLYWLEGNSSFDNPLKYKYARQENLNTSTLGHFQVLYRPYHEMEAKVDVSYTRNTADQLETFTQDYLNPYASNSYRNRLLAGDSYREIFTVEPQVNYSKTLSEGVLTAFVGATIQTQKAQSDDMELRDFPAENMFRNYGAAAVKYSVTGSTDSKKYASLFGRATYDFRNRYIFSGTLRRDGSSIFQKGHRFGNFWSVSGSWIFSQESFIRDNVRFLDFGKIKLTHGVTGNDNLAAFLYLNTYSVSPYPYGGSAGLYLGQVANPDFTWEKTRKSELSLDLVLLKNRLQIITALYRNQSGNFVDAVPLTKQAGMESYMNNVPGATIRNQGIEIELTSTNLTVGAFSWLTSLALTIPQNNRLIRFDNILNTSYATSLKVGESLNVKRLYRFTGINRENGVPMVEDVNRDGKITVADDKQFIGDIDADYYGGLHNSFRYKGVQLDLFLYFENRPLQEGFLKTFYYPAGYQGRNIPHEFAGDYWSVDNPDGKYPGLTTTTRSDIGYAYYYYYTESDAIYSDASYISLKNVALSWYLPKSVTGKLKLRNARIYVRGENLKTFSKYNNWNPESTTSIPPFRTIMAGFTLSL
ncbi:MAG: SusC/RagA family TonB-linked outer membrane protein [Tannerella sp.]|jgi:TonB-linked SusC/RagA family outer membrane protein|nr:SusC/RagA family TonB-linked outer membrane protein [Tannerella sp.]